MKKVKCNLDLLNCFKKGESYEVIYSEPSYAIIRDESKMPHGVKVWKKHFDL